METENPFNKAIEPQLLRSKNCLPIKFPLDHLPIFVNKLNFPNKRGFNYSFGINTLDNDLNRKKDTTTYGSK